MVLVMPRMKNLVGPTSKIDQMISAQEGKIPFMILNLNLMMNQHPNKNVNLENTRILET
jgi:hypothetical protein